MREVEERGDLGALAAERDRQIDEPPNVERRSSEIYRAVPPARDVRVSPAAVVRQDHPLVLARPQVVADELANQVVGEVLKDVLGDQEIGGGKLVGDVTDLESDPAGLVPGAHGRDDIGGDVDTEITGITPVDRAREAPIPTAGIDDRRDTVGLDEVFDVRAI